MFKLEDYAIKSNSFIGSSGRCNVVLEPTQSLGGLCIGNWRGSQDPKCLKTFKIAVVLDVAGIAYKYPDNMIRHCKVVKAIDEVEYDLSAHFDDCFDYIHEHRMKGCTVLVHCSAGISRSAAIVIGYLMKYENMDLKSALDFAVEKRPCIYPNKGFLKQLFEYGANIKQSSVENAS